MACVAVIAIATLAAVGGIAAAFGFFTSPIHKTGHERRLIVKLDAPYGSVDLKPGTDPNSVAAIQMEDADPSSQSPHWSYGLLGNDVGMLRIGIGTDEGQLMTPPLAIWKADHNFLPASTLRISGIGVRRQGSLYHVASETDQGSKKSNTSRTRIYLTRDLPIDFNANLGFGESSIDLTRLALTNVEIETGASRAMICSNEPNPQVLYNCSVKAGLGECTFCGISNLNAKHFSFSGAVGSYHLGFEGRLEQNLEARVSVGLGTCTISIPPLAGRVQIFYDDGMFTSYTFSGLAIRREGYATSPGFDRSNSPILTLRLSTGAGKMAVSYH
ncbi:MAG: hypothetical protein Q8922_00680 [Bacteroidota bacterium]|nr:hypothetical protein [Bacteroidota bacterium]MDP4232547.1 hypothetical protein [Bacteroidota bacterium]MDP4242998.1 hypothetical protein [Bacteroidota bacterium]MDP4286427.1 hypothetical protein [Bacteroidota bacterium]